MVGIRTNVSLIIHTVVIISTFNIFMHIILTILYEMGNAVTHFKMSELRKEPSHLAKR